MQYIRRIGSHRGFLSMRDQQSKDSGRKTKRTFPRIPLEWYKKLSIIAERRGQNLSSLTRDLYADLLEREFPTSSNQKPAK
jgi:hypothetical protein